MEEFYTSKQAAELLNVNESSIKRWSNAGILNCMKTPGGHRKFREADIVNFAQKYSLKIPLNSLKEVTPGKILSYEFDYDKLSDILLKKLFNHTEDDIFNFLDFTLKNGIPLTKIFDNIITTAFSKIGIMWADEKIGIEMEHIASNKMTNIIQRLRIKYQTHILTGHKVICASIGNELHEIPLLISRILFEQLGFDVIYAGVNIPSDSLNKLISDRKPDLVCISNTLKKDKKILNKYLKNIYTACKKSNALMVIGGKAFSEYENKGVYYDYKAENFTELISYTKKYFGFD